jgi:hypothetical protein
MDSLWEGLSPAIGTSPTGPPPDSSLPNVDFAYFVPASRSDEIKNLQAPAFSVLRWCSIYCFVRLKL